MKILLLCNDPYVMSPTTEILKNILNTNPFKNNEVYLLCLKNDNDIKTFIKYPIFRYSFDYDHFCYGDSFFTRVIKVFNKLYSLALLKLGLHNKVEIKIIFKTIIKLNSIHNFDYFLSIEDANNNRSNSLILLKKKLPSAINGVFWVEMPVKIGTIKFNTKYLKKINKYIEYSFVRKRDYNKFKNHISNDKLVVNEFPCELINYDKLNIKNNNISYFGKLRNNDPNTKLLFDVVEKLTNYTFDLYLTNNDLFGFNFEKYGNVIVHKPQPINDLHEEISKSCALLCVESKTTVGFTCKYITYMSSGKPILFVGDVIGIDDDLEKYKSYFILNNTTEDSVILLEDFLSQNNGYDYKRFDKDFLEYTNEYIASKLLEPLYGK